MMRAPPASSILARRMRDVHVDVVGVAHVFVAQRFVRDAFAREHGLGMRHKQGEDIELAGRERNGRAADRDFAAVGVERNRAHGERGGGERGGNLGRVTDRGHRSGADTRAACRARPDAANARSARTASERFNATRIRANSSSIANGLVR